MTKGGPERMIESAQQLSRLRETIDQGQSGSKITFPLQEAALMLRIPASTLANLEKREQMLGISVESNYVSVKLQSNPNQQKQSYRFLYGFLQSCKSGQANQFLENQPVPPSLLEEIPDFKETLAVVKKGISDLTDEEITALHLHLYGRWRLLQDKSLFPPERVFS